MSEAAEQFELKLIEKLHQFDQASGEVVMPDDNDTDVELTTRIAEFLIDHEELGDTEDSETVVNIGMFIYAWEKDYR